ncbi:MAG: hypothetical protein GAK28_00175 [Luteibacter sp.]|uniref:hypothetical protein n=1 Tax=Luteibacter sp. TaxID=1886636 RepID=UPI001380D2F9|nr:hypothetical protein [Luteibacter sp.]KAF1009537.1 MAG: hypothetical protein GAK28_00175 [Luteibacter sp.]
MADTKTLEGTRDQIRAFAQLQPRDCESKNYYVEMNVLLMDDWWKAIDAHLASQPAEQPRDEPLVNRQDIRQVCRTIDGLKDLLFDANALDAEALSLHKAGCDAILRIGDLSRESAQPKPEQAVGDGVESAKMLADALAEITVTRYDDDPSSETYDADGHSRCVDIADAALLRYEQAITTARPAVATPAEVTDLHRLLEGFTVTVERNPLVSPATYLDEVRLCCEFQPGQGRVRADALRAALTSQCQVRKDTQGLDDSGRLTPCKPKNYASLNELRNWFDWRAAHVTEAFMVYAPEFAAWRDAIDYYSRVPHALADVVSAVRRFDECAEDGEDVDIGRDWFDALTTIGLLRRVQRSPARWEMTDAGRSLLELASSSAQAAAPPGWKLVPVEPTAAILDVIAWHLDEAQQGPPFFPQKVFDALLAASPSAGAAVPEVLLADLRKFHEEAEACDEFDLTSEATAALLSANLIEGTHFVLTAKGKALLADAPEVPRG